MKRMLIAAAGLMVAAPAFAGEFYIVRDGDDKECRIVETRPSEETVIVVGERAYVTREEAERELTLVCKRD
jgi:hypothetical protein